MGYGNLTLDARSALQEIARMAYGSGLFEGTSGGKGRMGVLFDESGNARVVKFNTHVGERMGGDKANKEMLGLSNNLRLMLKDIADSAGLDNSVKSEIYAKLWLKEDGSLTENANPKSKDLLSRKVVASVVSKIGGDQVWKDAWSGKDKANYVSAKNTQIKDINYTAEDVENSGNLRFVDEVRNFSKQDVRDALENVVNKMKKEDKGICNLKDRVLKNVLTDEFLDDLEKKGLLKGLSCNVLNGCIGKIISGTKGLQDGGLVVDWDAGISNLQNDVRSILARHTMKSRDVDEILKPLKGYSEAKNFLAKVASDGNFASHVASSLSLDNLMQTLRLPPHEMQGIKIGDCRQSGDYFAITCKLPGSGNKSVDAYFNVEGKLVKGRAPKLLSDKVMNGVQKSHRRLYDAESFVGHLKDVSKEQGKITETSIGKISGDWFRDFQKEINSLTKEEQAQLGENPKEFGNLKPRGQLYLLDGKMVGRDFDKTCLEEKNADGNKKKYESFTQQTLDNFFAVHKVKSNEMKESLRHLMCQGSMTEINRALLDGWPGFTPVFDSADSFTAVNVMGSKDGDGGFDIVMQGTYHHVQALKSRDDDREQHVFLDPSHDNTISYSITYHLSPGADGGSPKLSVKKDLKLYSDFVESNWEEYQEKGRKLIEEVVTGKKTLILSDYLTESWEEAKASLEELTNEGRKTIVDKALHQLVDIYNFGQDTELPKFTDKSLADAIYAAVRIT